MKETFAKRSVALFAAAFVAVVVLNGAAMGIYDFEKAWKDVEAAQRKNLPRTVTNKVEEIEREATKAARWPDAARAFLVREDAMKQFTDGESRPDEWLPAFAASVDAKPAPLQAVLQLHLAHTYQENSRRWRWGGAAPTKLDDEAAKDKMPPWSPEKITATLESQFEKVFAHSDELKKMKLDDWSALFNRGTWPAQYCPTLFDFAVRDAIQFFGGTIPDKTLEKGLALYDALIEFHRADENIDARAMAEIHRAEYICTFDEKPKKERDGAFAAFLDGFLKEYEGKTEATAYAASVKASILRNKNDLVAAHDLAAAYAAKWPDSPGGKMCANIVADIEAKNLDVEVERNWCAPWPAIEVKAKNLDEVHFRLVSVSFDDLVKDCSMGEEAYNINARSAIKDNYLKRAPAKEWTQRLDLKPGYAEQKFSCPVPQGLPCGHYVLYAAANDKFGADKQPIFAQYITVTTLALAMKTGNGNFGGTVYLAESGKQPVEGAKVELWGYPQKGGRFQALRETYVTDKNGEFKAEVDRKAGSNALSRHVRVVYDGAEVLSLGNEGSGYIYEDDKTVEFIDLFTDRSLYRPGQEIKVKGIAYHADPFTRDFRTQREVTVRLLLNDPNGKEVASVNIEEYKRPKFTASFEGAPEKAELGKPVTVTGKALTYSGLPVQHARVEWHVERETRYPGWWRWFCVDNGDDGENFVGDGETETDENGVFKVTFTPVASPTADLSGDPSFEFTVMAHVTDDTGEERSATESFEIGTVQWRASVWAEGSWHTPEKGVPVRVTVNSLAGAKLPVKGTLKAFRLVAPERPARKPAGSGRYGYGGDEKGPWDWKTWEVGEEVASREITHAAAEKWQGEMPLPVGAYRLVFETKDPNGKTVKDIHLVCVFDPKADHLALAVPTFFCAEKTTVKVGETLRAHWGTGYETGVVRVRITNNRKVILDELRESTSWFHELPIKDEHRGEMRIETTFVRENRLYKDGATFNIPWDNKYLDIKVEHLTSKLNPGKEETWKFKVSGPSEVLAFMYDRSLDAYKWHNVSTGFSDHFTPYERYLMSPILQNTTKNLYRLDGRFPITRLPADFSWPSWKIVPSRYGINMVERKLALRGGFDGAVAACEPMAGAVECEEACEDVGMLADVVCGWSSKESASQSAVLTEDRSSAADVPRKNLKETAFFFPDLETDAEGNVSLTFTVPDALTGWKLLMVVHDNELRSGVLRNEEIVTMKPLMCEPNPPRFAREGDDFLFPVKVTNTEEWEVGGEVLLHVGRLDSDELDNPEFKSFSLAPHESKTIEFRVSIPDGSPYLWYIAKATAMSSPVVQTAVCGTPSGSPVSKTIVPFKKYTDGEEGVLPVLSRRILVREAVQLNVRGNATKSFKFENLIASKGSDTIRHQNLTVRAVSRPAWYAVLSLPYLMEFPHECCEQTFSTRPPRVRA